MIENDGYKDEQELDAKNIDVDASTNSSCDSIDLNKDELDYIPS